MIIKTIVILCSMSLFTCRQKVPDDAASRQPTAAEIFTLRTKCTELGDKIFENNLIGSALTQSQVSHYNPNTNRCYVELDVSTVDLTKVGGYHTRTLYDGQTREMLVHISDNNGKRGYYVKGVSLLDGTVTCEVALAKIEPLMADDRRQ